MDAFDITIAVTAVSGFVIGMLITGSWLGGLLGLRLGLALGSLLFLVVCVGAVALLERRKRHNGRR